MLKYQDLINEALRLEKSTNFLEYFFKELTYIKYEKIAVLYEKAGNICKMTNRELSIEYFVKSYNFYELANSLDYDYKLKVISTELVELYSKINYHKSIEYMYKILDWYSMKGDIQNIIKTYKSMGDIYFYNNDLNNAKQIYFKAIDLIDTYDKSLDIKRHIVEKISNMYYIKQNIIQLPDLSKLYFSIAEDYFKKNLGYIGAINFIFDGLLANICFEDYVSANNNFEHYCNIDSTFTSSQEGKFINNLLKIIETNNLDEFGYLCLEYEKIKLFTNIQVKLLLKIKKNITQFDNLNNNADDINDFIDFIDFIDGELDLC